MTICSYPLFFYPLKCVEASGYKIIKGPYLLEKQDPFINHFLTLFIMAKAS